MNLVARIMYLAAMGLSPLSFLSGLALTAIGIFTVDGSTAGGGIFLLFVGAVLFFCAGLAHEEEAIGTQPLRETKKIQLGTEDYDLFVRAKAEDKKLKAIEARVVEENRSRGYY